MQTFCFLSQPFRKDLKTLFLFAASWFIHQAEARKQRDDWLRESLAHRPSPSAAEAPASAAFAPVGPSPLLPPPPPPAASAPASAASAPGLMPLQVKRPASPAAAATARAASAPVPLRVKLPPWGEGPPPAGFYAPWPARFRDPDAPEPAQKAMPRLRQVLSLANYIPCLQLELATIATILFSLHLLPLLLFLLLRATCGCRRRLRQLRRRLRQPRRHLGSLWRLPHLWHLRHLRHPGDRRRQPSTGLPGSGASGNPGPGGSTTGGPRSGPARAGRSGTG